jgi:signal transduction histidine kinase
MLRAAQEELHHATQMATLGEVSGRVAHEILNPLTAVTAKVARLDDGVARLGELAGFVRGEASVAAGESAAALQAAAEALDEHGAASAHDLAFIASELQRIERLVHDLRGVRRSGVERAEVGLLGILQYCREVMSSAIARSATEERCSCPDDVYVEVDRGELVQALTNLIRNAIEAHEELPPGAMRELSLAAEAQGDVAVIRVVDSGRGVPEEIAPRIFEASFTTKPSGAGIGLAIARRLVRAHGGDLVLAPSEPGRGATFLVTLPCRTRAPAGWEG